MQIPRILSQMFRFNRFDGDITIYILTSTPGDSDAGHSQNAVCLGGRTDRCLIMKGNQAGRRGESAADGNWKVGQGP